MMVVHELKTDPVVFQKSWDGIKTFEMRRDDRFYRVGDKVILKETEFSSFDMAAGKPLIFTKREIECSIKYVLHGPIYGLDDGWVIFSVKLMNLIENISS